MAKLHEQYVDIIVESYRASGTSGLHGSVHIRPIAGQGYSSSLHVQCWKGLRENYPIGTKFRIKAKLTDREGEGDFLYSSYRWKYEVLN